MPKLHNFLLISFVLGTKLDPDDPIDLAQFEYPEGESGRTPDGHSGRGGRRLHGNPRYVKGQRGLRGPGARGYDGVKSSAMSDTSEAPSIASHVRGVAIPSHGSDVDQFLDDLFMPVLDGNIDDGLSDARSLAASMKGGKANGPNIAEERKEDVDEEIVEILSRQTSLRRGPQQPILKDLNEHLSYESQIPTSDEYYLLNVSQCSSSNLSALCQATALLSEVKGGTKNGGDGTDDEEEAEREVGEGGKNMPNKKKSNASVASNELSMNAGGAMMGNIGFQPITGMLSPTPMMGGMMSPPPMLMPTPIQGGMMSAPHPSKLYSEHMTYCGTVCHKENYTYLHP